MENGYTANPATAFVAQNCCFCGRSLLEPDSLTCGYGPTCAEKYGLAWGTGYDGKSEVSKILYALAVHQRGPEAEKLVLRIRELGFEKIAGIAGEAIKTWEHFAEKKLGKAPTLTYDNRGFFLAFEYSAATVSAVKDAIRTSGGRGSFKNDNRGKGWELDLRAALAVGAVFDGRLNVHAGAAAHLKATPAAVTPAKACTSVGASTVAVATPYNPQAVQALKAAAQGQARWDGASKRWSFPTSVAGAVAAALRPFFPSVADELTAYAPAAKPAPVTAALTTAKDASEAGAAAGLIAEVTERLAAALPAGKTPYGYQNVGVAFVEGAFQAQGAARVLIADEMGLGKTVQALGWVALHPELRRVLVVCPSSLTLNWAREAGRWVPGRSVAVVRTTKGALPANPDLVVCSYDLVVRRRAELEKIGFDVAVLDECHMLKAQTAKRTKEIFGYDQKVA